MPRCALTRSGHQVRLHRPRRDAPRQGASLFRTAEGEFTLLAARALEACHRAGRRGGDQVGAPPRAGDGGRAPARPELVHLRGGRRHGDRRRDHVPHRRARSRATGESVHDQIAATGRAGPAARALRRAGSSTTRPSTSAARCRTCSAARWTRGEANELLAAEGHSRAAARGQRRDRAGHAHLPPVPAGVVEGARGGGAHARPRLRARGVHRGRRLARGPGGGGGGGPAVPRGERGGRRHARRIPNVERTEAAMSEGFYEAIIRSLAGKLRNQSHNRGVSGAVGIAPIPPDSGGCRCTSPMHITPARCVAGACMVVAPLVLLVAMVIHPASDMDEATQVATIADNLDAWYVAHLLALVSIVLTVPGGARPDAHAARAARWRSGTWAAAWRCWACSRSRASSAMELVMWQMAGGGQHRRGGGAARAAERDDWHRGPVRARVVRVRARHGVPGGRAVQGARRAVVDGGLRRGVGAILFGLGDRRRR